MFKSKSILIAATILIIAILGIFFYQNSAQSGNKNPNTVSQLPDRKVKIAYLPLTSTLPFFIAQEKGFFKANNVEIEATELGTSNLTAEAVQRGDYDLSYYTTAVAGLNANQKDPNKVLIYTTNGDNDNKQWDGLFVKTTSGITKPEELIGKKIGVFPGSTGTAYIKDFLKSKGIDNTKVEYVQLPPANQKPALDTGSIDALFSYEPTTTLLSKSPDYKKIQSTILYANPDAVIGMGTINKEFTQKYPDLTKRAVKAIDQGTQYLRTNEAESRQILAKYVKVDPSILNDIVLYNMNLSTEINPEITQKYFDYLLELGELKQKVDAKGLIYKAQ
jgi:NitT/TauT family transport system substrate-binding protein